MAKPLYVVYYEERNEAKEGYCAEYWRISQMAWNSMAKPLYVVYYEERNEAKKDIVQNIEE